MSGDKLTITPHGNNQSWTIHASVDPKTCTASVDFNVKGKPSPPPVDLLASLDTLVPGGDAADGKARAAIVFSDPTGTIAKASVPVNAWIEL